MSRLPRSLLCGGILALTFLTACGAAPPRLTCSGNSSSAHPGAVASSTARPDASSPTTTVSTKIVSFSGVGISVPASWPVLDGAHGGFSCGSRFYDQADRVFVGVTYMGAPSCPGGSGAPPPADGVWMQPGSSNPPVESATELPSGQKVYVLEEPQSSSVNVWYHKVSMDIGIGPDRSVEQAILDSIRYDASAPDTAVLGRCPAPDPSPPPMPSPVRLTAPLVLPDDDATMRPEPPTVQPKVTPASVWNAFFANGASYGPIEWHVYFGSYSASTPAEINPNGSTTPDYQGVAAWLIEGEGAPTPYGPCGPTILAPYNADSGRTMDLTTIG